MRVQLKQPEIIEALKQYVANQGINMSGKEMKVKFTAGRKDAGLSADLSIEDVPGTGVAGSIKQAEVGPQAAAPAATGYAAPAAVIVGESSIVQDDKPAAANEEASGKPVSLFA